MERTAVIVDENLLEQIQYDGNTLPLLLCRDCFDEFIGGEVNCHWHDEFEFGLVLKGEVEFHIHQRDEFQESRTLREGEGIFINAKTLHMGRQLRRGTVVFCLVFPAAFFSFQLWGTVYPKCVLPVAKVLQPGLFLTPEHEADKGVLDGLWRLSRLDKEMLGYELMCIECICGIWRHLLMRISGMEEFPAVSNEEGLQEQRIRLMLSYIHTHYSEPVTIDDISDAASVSRSECFRCFRGIVRKTPVEYLCGYRLSRAAQLLTNTDRTVFDISSSCGFASASYFGKMFREAWGMSPGTFRKRNGSGSLLGERGGITEGKGRT